MRILFYSSTFPHGTARVAGTFNLELCRALAIEHDVRVVAPRSFVDAWRSRGSRTDRVAADGWVREATGLTASYPSYFYTPGIARHRYGDWQWLSVGRHLRAVVDEFQPDAVVSYWAHPDGEVGLRVAQAANIPSVVIVGGSDVLLLPRDRRRRPKIERVLRESSAVMTVSDGLRQSVIDLGADPSRVATIYQGVDDELFHPGSQAEARQALSLPNDRKFLLWVGRMVDVKGLDTLIEAFDLAQQKIPKLQLLLVGDGPERSAVQRDIDRRGLNDFVRFIGPKSHSELPNWYRAADLVVLSSWSEGLPNVLREAVSCGRPFVSTNVGSVCEIADSHGGPAFAELVPIRDAVTLASAIGRTLRPEYLAAAQLFPCRSWRDTADDLVSLLRRLRGESATSTTRQRVVSERMIQAEATHTETTRLRVVLTGMPLTENLSATIPTGSR